MFCVRSSEFQDESIVRERHARRQPGIRLFVTEIVAHVCKQGAPGRDASCRFDRFRKREMRGMRTVSQCVEHHDIEAVQQGPGALRDGVAVRQVRESVEAETEDLPRSVKQWDRDNPLAVDGDIAVDREEIQRRQASTAGRRWIEDVREGLSNAVERHPVPIAGHRMLLCGGKASRLVEPQYVIGMAMSEQNGIDPPDVVSERLLAQVGSCVDQDRCAVGEFDEYRRSQPFIARIG